MLLKHAKKTAIFTALIMILNIIPAGTVLADGTEAVEAASEVMQEEQADLVPEGISAVMTDAAAFEENASEQTDTEDTEPEDEEALSDPAGGAASAEEKGSDPVSAADADEPGSSETEGSDIFDLYVAGDGKESPNEKSAEADEESGRGAGNEKILTVSGSGTSRTMTVADTSAIYSSMQAAVWSDSGGQDDIKWYTMTRQSDGSFTASLSVGNLRHSGICYVHVYSGSIFIDGEIFTVTDEEFAEFRLKITGEGTARTVTLPGIYGNSEFKAAVWSKEGGQDDLKWHNMSKQSDGSCSVDISAADLKHSGVGYVHVYSGSSFIDGGVFEFSAEDMAALKLTVTGSDGKRTITLPAGYSVSSLRAAVWSTAGGQDDLKWHDMTKNSDGSWTTMISADDLLHYGNCVVHVYSGSTYIDGNTFTIDADEIRAPSISVSGSDGVRTLTLSDGSALKNVKAAVWSKEGGQDDLKWHDMTKQSDGSWIADILARSFKHSGVCYVHVYSGSTYLDGAEFQFADEEFEETEENIFTVSGEGGRRILTVGGPCTGLSSLKAAVWSTEGGQGDLKWYTAEKQSDGTWKIDISISVLLNGGTINVHGYSGNEYVFGMKFDISDSEYEESVQDLTHQYAQSILNTTGGTLRGVYDWVVQNLTYQSLVTPMIVPSSGTYSVFTRQELYLVYAYERLRGNCFCYAAPVFWCAKELGYTVRLMEHMYNFNNDPNDTRPHGWVEIDLDGTTYILDAELQQQYNMDVFMVRESPLQLRRDLNAY